MKDIGLLLLAVLPATALLNAQVVTALPSSLAFTWQVGAALPPAQTVAVSITAGNPAWTVSTPLASDPWLIATQGTINLPGAVSVQVNPSTLTPGAYSAPITIAAIGAPSVSVNVLLTVTEPYVAPTITPVTLAFATAGPALTGQVSITAGPSPLTFTATTSPSWLSVSSNVGAILPAETQSLTVTAIPGILAPQAAPYVGKLSIITTTGGITLLQVVTVNLTVGSASPTVTSVWPTVIAAGSLNTTVTIRGTNFYTITTVTAAGQAAPLKLTLLSSSVILATLPTALLTSPSTIDLTVTNPLGGGSAAPVAVVVGNGPAIAAITNGASYAGGLNTTSIPNIATAISPGEIVAIFGQNLGPVPAVLFTPAGGFVPTTDGGVTVMIGSTPAPILYAGPSQVNVQVPYEETPSVGTLQTVTLTNAAGSVPVTVNIAAAVPGIFTSNSSGSGAAIALNFVAAVGTGSSSFAVNAASAPAKIGTVVTFFLTGEGDYGALSYMPETGLVVPTTPPAVPGGGAYPQLSPLPTVTIGGKTATVNYAGPIPTSILGLLQLNVVVPAGAAAAAGPVALVVTIAGVATQANVTLYVTP